MKKIEQLLNLSSDQITFLHIPKAKDRKIMRLWLDYNNISRVTLHAPWISQEEEGMYVKCHCKNMVCMKYDDCWMCYSDQSLWFVCGD